jgi:FkbM family methyltransferase
MKPINYKDYLDNHGVIVQLGANNGVDCEDCGLRELMLAGNYTCHLVEPLEQEFNDLKLNYASATSDMHYYNYAISSEDGTAQFYNFNVFSSLIQENLKDHTAKEGYAVINVTTKLLTTFFQEANITEINGLFLDVEGVEGIIFYDLINKTNIRPRVIRYEWPHMKDGVDVEKFIIQNGYTIYSDIYNRWDRVCVRNDLLNLVGVQADGTIHIVR